MVDDIDTSGLDELPDDAPVELTDAQKREAEIAAGKAALEKHKDEPQPEHPSLTVTLDQEAALAKLRKEQGADAAAKAQAELSPAAKANKAIFDQIKNARSQPVPPPPPPMKPTQEMLDRTAQEIAAGKAAANRHVQSQLNAVRKQPTENELKLQTRTVPVYQPDTPIKAEVFPASPRLPHTTSTDDRKRKVRSA